MVRNGRGLVSVGAFRPEFEAASWYIGDMAPSMTALDSRAALERVLAVARVIGQSANLGEILELVIDAMRDTLDAERATVFQYDPATKELFTTVAHGLNGVFKSVRASEARQGDALPQIRIPVGTGIAGQAAASRAMINIPDAYADSRFNAEVDRKTGFRTRSILTVPLVGHEGELIGVAQVLNKRGGAFGPDDEALAQALAAQAAVAIRRGRLIEDRVVRERLERDLQVARSIQQQTFPRVLPVAPGFDIAAMASPADETGGDAYDIVGLRRAAPGVNGSPVVASNIAATEVLFLLGDATGHGIGPALSATQVRSMLRMAIRLNADLSGIVHHVNQQLCEDLPSSRFVTAWFGRLDVTAGVLEGLSAGQGPLLFYQASSQTCRVIEPGGVPLGIVEEWRYDKPFSLAMQPGDVFVALTDGFFEAAAPSGDRCGEERIIENVRALAGQSAAGILDGLVAALHAFTSGAPAEDDQTGIVLKRI
jgi:phosphoserine phosphatase RsbU/P